MRSLGDPAWLYRRLPHPVVLIGPRASPASRRAGWTPPRQLPPSAGAARAASLIVIAASAAARRPAAGALPALPQGWLALALLMSTLLAWRGLDQHVAAVARGLEHSLADGRQAVARIVGRDPESLDAHAVARAAIESAAENFADAVVAPLLFGLLLGLPGMLAYKAINTPDSMIGHRSPRFFHFGRFAARLDDARQLAAGPARGFSDPRRRRPGPRARPATGWRALRADARRHRSPNAGWPEAAIAGCLGLRLAGPRRYSGTLIDDAWMGEGRAAATPADIRCAAPTVRLATLITAGLLALPLAAALA